MCGWFVGATWRARVARRIEEIALYTVNWKEVVVVPFQHSPINLQENLRIVSAPAGRDSNWRYPESK